MKAQDRARAEFLKREIRENKSKIRHLDLQNDNYLSELYAILLSE